MSTSTGEISDRRAPRWSPPIKIVVIVLIIAALSVAFYLFRVIFVPLIIGSIMAYIFHPLVCRIQRLTRLPRGLATGVLYLILMILVVPIIWSLLPVAVRQISFLQKQLIDFTRYLNSVAPGTTVPLAGFEVDVKRLINEATSGVTGVITSVAPESITFFFTAARTTLLAVFTLVIGFYLTRDAEKVTQWFRDLIPLQYRGDVERLLAEIDEVWTAFFRGQVTLALTVTVILTTLSYLLGLPRPLLLGVWGGLLEFLPSVGNMIWGATAIISAIVGGSTIIHMPRVLYILIVIGVYVAYSQVDINVLIPYIIGHRIRLHPVVVIGGVIVGATLGGVLGVALAAPTIACLRVIGRYVYAKLFDLEPFPMVGPPSAPPAEREAEAERMAAAVPQPHPITEVLSEKAKQARLLRKRRPKVEEGNDNVEEDQQE